MRRAAAVLYLFRRAYLKETGLRIYCNGAERDLILEKMKLVPTRNMAAYLRKIAIDGYIIQTDHSDIKAMTAEIQKIGVNVNQIDRKSTRVGNEGKYTFHHLPVCGFPCAPSAQLDALLDTMSDKGIRIVTATAKEIAEVEKEGE